MITQRSSIPLASSNSNKIRVLVNNNPNTMGIMLSCSYSFYTNKLTTPNTIDKNPRATERTPSLNELLTTELECCQ